MPETVQYVYASDENEKEAVVVEKVPSLAGQLILATLVLVFGNVLFGLLALIIALIANSFAVKNPKKARDLGKVSLGLSVAGVMISFIIVIIVLILRMETALIA